LLGSLAKMKNRYLLSLLFFTLICNVSFGQLSVNNCSVLGLTPQQFVQNWLVGSGVSVTNATFNGSSSVITSEMLGSFVASGNALTQLGIDSGVIMTTGSANSAVGPNTNCYTGTDVGGLGDPDLTTLCGAVTYDKCVIEFDFIPITDTIKFKYVFGSEEFFQYCYQYNDPLGFFLSGPGISGTFSNGSIDIALMPNQSNYVCINNICSDPTTAWCNNSSTSCIPTFQCHNSPANSGLYFQYNALTFVYTAMHYVQPCQTYHVKIAVADASDRIMDSGVFLKKGSFSSSSISGNSNVCQNSTGNVYTTQPGMTSYVWTVSPGGTITAGGTSTSNFITVTWNGVGPQLVSVNYNNSYGCSMPYPTTFKVTVNPLPIPVITGLSAVCCNNSAVYTTQAGMTGYSWNVSSGGTINGGGTSGSSTATVYWSIPGPQTVSVNYTNGNGCRAATPIIYSVTVNPLPVPTITGPAAVCVNALGNVYSTEPGMSNYIWSLPAGGTITSGGTSGSNTATVTWTTPGLKSVGVRYTNNCTSNFIYYPVTVNPLPTPTITGNTSVCVGSTGIVYTTQGSMSNYSWMVSAGGSITSGGGSNDNTVTVNWTTTGVQTVSVNYTNANGCTAASPVIYTLSVHPWPVPSITGSSSICKNATAVYTTEAGMTAYNWSVSSGGTITGGGTYTSNSVTVQWNTPGSQTVSVNYVNSNGCTAASPTSYVVTVNSLPLPTITGPINVCVNAPGNVYTTEAGMSNYVWLISAGGNLSSGGNSTSNTATVTWTSAGSKTVSVNYANSNNCTAGSPTIYNVMVNSLPTPTIAGNASVCMGSTGNVYTTQVGMSNYSWVVSAGGLVTSGGGSNDNTVTVSWNTPGSQTVSVNYTNPNGCLAAFPVNYPVTVNPLPVPSLSGNTNVCAGSTGVVYTTDAGKSNYTWAVSAGGTITSGGTLTSNTVTVTWSTQGPQSVGVNYKNSFGCWAANPTIVAITVNPLPVPTVSGPATICAISAGNVYTTEAGMTNYSWNVSSGGVITSGGTSTSNTASVTWNNPGSQTVSVNYNGTNGCIATVPTIYTVLVSASPIPTITGPASVCVGSSGNNYTTQSGMTGYSWNVSSGGTITGGGTSTSNYVTVTWNSSGAQTVSVNYFNGNCPALTPTVNNITVIPNSTLNLSSAPSTMNQSICFNNPITNITFSIGGSATGASAVGLPAGVNGVYSSGVYTISGTPLTTGTFNFTVTTTGPCLQASASGTITVFALPIPTIIGDSSVCSDSTSNIYTTEAGKSAYNWSVSAGGTITAGGTATSNTVIVTWLTTGAQTVTVDYTDANGCTGASATVYNVVVNPHPVPTISGPVSACEFSTGNNYTTESGRNNYVWTVSSGGTITAGGTSTDDFVTVTWNVPGSQSIFVNYADSNGCRGIFPATENITINPLPLPTVSGPSTACISSSGNTYITEAGMSNYLWNVSLGGTLTGGQGTNTISVTWNNSGPQFVDVTYTNQNGCSAQGPVTFNVTVSPLPDAAGQITGPNQLCSGYHGFIYSVPPIPNAAFYIWSVPYGFNVTSGNGTNAIVVDLAADAMSGNITVTGNNSCGDGITSPPFAVFTNLPDTCYAGPDNVTCTNIPFTVSQAWALHANSVLWSSNGTGTLSNASTLTPTYTPAINESGIIVLTMIAYGDNACKNDTSYTKLTINKRSTVYAGDDISSCSSQPVLLSGSVADNYTTLKWTTSGSGIFDDSTKLHAVYYPGITDKLNGQVLLVLHGYSQSPCEPVSDTLVLTLNQLPVAIPGPDGNICQGDTYTVQGVVINHAFSFSWQDDGTGELQDTHTLTPTYIPGQGELGIVLLTLKAIGIEGCQDSSSTCHMNVNIYPDPAVVAGNSQIIKFGTSTTLDCVPSAGSGRFHFAWKPVSLLLDDTIRAPQTLSLLGDTVFIITITDLVTGCTASDSLSVRLEEKPGTETCLKVHNVITPNGDGINDKLVIDCIEMYPENKLELYNIWGELVNSFVNYNNNDVVWKGTNKHGDPLPNGTYYYVLNVKFEPGLVGWIYLR
jgi:gliding motility-associated-like protein